MKRLTETGKVYTFRKVDPAENAYLERVQKRLAAYEDICFDVDGKERITVEELSALVKARDEGLVQSMSCIGCRYDQTSSLREHEANCMRCIRNRYPDDHYTRAEAEAALQKGGPHEADSV